MTNLDDLLGLADDGRPLNRRAKKARKSLGKLHALMTAKLPDLIDPQSQVCNLHKVAKLRGMSFQGVYKWFKNHEANQLPYAQAIWLVELSVKQKNGGADFIPMTFEEIQPFITPA